MITNMVKIFCPFFALCTINSFFSRKNMVKCNVDKNDGKDHKYEHIIDLSKQAHELCLAKAVTAHALNNIGDQMFFEKLIRFTNLNVKDINATNVELILNNIIGYDVIFPKEWKIPYAVLFLKNGKFIVVLHHDDKYYVRDCHESLQFNNLSRPNVIAHMNKVYQFDQEIDLGGYKIQEYSNIEFMHIMNSFTTTIDLNVHGSIVDKFSNTTEKNKSSDIDNDDSEKDIYNDYEKFADSVADDYCDFNNDSNETVDYTDT